MSYYWFNREKLLKNVWNKYHNKGGKQKAAKRLPKKQNAALKGFIYMTVKAFVLFLAASVPL